MSLQTTKEISIDVSKYKYISIDAKQYDRNLRYILITCKNQDDFIPMNGKTHFASIRYRKPDNHGVFNACEITEDGKILVELTEQMLAVAGTCYADVVIHNNVKLVADIGTTTVDVDGETLELLKLEDLHNNEIISTMTFIVHVHKAAFDNEEIESSYEYNKLNDLIAKAENTYEIVMDSCKKSEENAKKSSEAASGSASSASSSQREALISANAANRSALKAEESENAARRSESNTNNYASNASRSANNANNSATAAAASEQAAADSATTANASATAADASATAANNSAKLAAASEQAAANSATAAAASEGIAINNANLCKDIANNLNSGFIPIGTITFDELATAEKATGFTYNISDDFITDETFREGAGMSYTAGTNVYYTADGQWDCFGGTASPTATVDEVREYLGI